MVFSFLRCFPRIAIECGVFLSHDGFQTSPAGYTGHWQVEIDYILK